MKVNRKQTFVFRRCDLLMPFFINYFKKHISVYTFRLVFKCILVARKENLTGFFTGLTGRSKNLDPAGDPTGFHLWCGPSPWLRAWAAQL